MYNPGSDDIAHYAVIVCNSNSIYAKEYQEELLESGYRNVFIPQDFGLVYSPDKLDGIEFNLNIGCSLNCLYCPQGVLLNSYGKRGKNSLKRYFTFDDFKFILDERMNPGASVSFSGMSEPFENADFMKMLFYASESGNTILLNTTLMGVTEEMLETIISKGVKISECILHIPDNKGNSHFRITDDYIKVLRKFLVNYGNSIIYITCHGDAPNEAIIDLVENSGIKDIHYEDMMGARCGNLDKKIKERPAKRNGRRICTLGKAPCLPPVCMPDGTLGLCCNDYALDTEIGNILDDDWKTVTLGRGVQKYLQAMDNDDLEYICRYCGCATERDDAIRQVYPDYLCYGENYYRVRALMMEGTHEIAKKVQNAEHVCIFGLGKFFRDNYFQAGWNNVIKADLLSDNNEKLWGKSFEGIKVIPKQQLLSYHNLLIVVYTMAPDAIIEDLYNFGLRDVIRIKDIMEM